MEKLLTTLKEHRTFGGFFFALKIGMQELLLLIGRFIGSESK
jgi:hypothetical protein